MATIILETFIKAGCVVSTPTCRLSWWTYGHLAGERCLATTNRNFVGRMGHIESEVYLCSPQKQLLHLHSAGMYPSTSSTDKEALS